MRFLIIAAKDDAPDKKHVAVAVHFLLRGKRDISVTAKWIVRVEASIHDVCMRINTEALHTATATFCDFFLHFYQMLAGSEHRHNLSCKYN